MKTSGKLLRYLDGLV
jgi:hypothetical protein